METYPELLAHHYTEVGLSALALPYWQRAGQRAIERSAIVEAVGHLTKGLELLKTLPETPERNQQELTMQLTLGASLLTVKSQAAPEVEHAYTRAQELCQQVGDHRQLFSVLAGLRRFHLNRGSLRTAHELGERCFVLAQGLQDRALLQEAHGLLGSTLFLMGELASARMHMEQSLVLYDSQHCRLRTLLSGAAPRVSCLTRAALMLWMLGYPDQALARMREALTLAQESSHVYNLGYALRFGARLHQLRREAPLAQELAEAAMALTHEHGIVYQTGSGLWIQGWALAEQGSMEEGIVQLRKDLAARQALGIEQEVPHMLAVLAQVYGKGGHTEDGLRVLAEALTLVHKNEERHYEAEVYRLKGELLLQQAVGKAVTRTNVVETAVGAEQLS